MYKLNVIFLGKKISVFGGKPTGNCSNWLNAAKKGENFRSVERYIENPQA
jgi:hypothetical protein